MIKRTALIGGLLASLAACQTPENPAPAPVAAAAMPIYKTSFVCQNGTTAVQNRVCADAQLAALDLQLAAEFRRHLRADSLFQRDQILSNQRAWLIDLPTRCQVPAIDNGAQNPTSTACLVDAYRKQLTVLTEWPSVPSSSANAIANYVQYKLLDGKDPTLCARLGEQALTVLSDDGAIDPTRLEGAREIAGTHGSTAGQTPDGGTVQVDSYEAGLYGGYEIRARSVSMAGSATPLLGPTAVGNYVASLPNSGGRFSVYASQTGDYGAIDVFSFNGQLLALLTDVVGFNAPAPPGESSAAAVFTITHGVAAPTCLFQTYRVPPNKGAFDEQPALTPFISLIDDITGSPPAELAASDRQDSTYLSKETRWMQFNMPLVLVAQARQGGWIGFLRYRHDQVLDNLFAWSQKSPENQAEFNRLFSLLRPGAADLSQIYRQQQGLSAKEAEQASALTMMELLYQATIYRSPGLAGAADGPEKYNGYKPRYPILASPQP